MPNKRRVEIVDSRYQPSKAELEESFPPLSDQYPGITAKDVARAIVSPIEIVHVPRPKRDGRR